MILRRRKLQGRGFFFGRLPLATKQQADEALTKLKALVEPMVEHHAKIIGVRPSRVSFKPMISRWGMCHVRDGSFGDLILTYNVTLPTCLTDRQKELLRQMRG